MLSVWSEFHLVVASLGFGGVLITLSNYSSLVFSFGLHGFWLDMCTTHLTSDGGTSVDPLKGI